MKLRSVFKIAIITSVVLLCIGFVVFFYFRITKVEKVEEFNLYTIVPSSAVAVVDSDNIVELLTGINNLSCNKKENLNNISYLFSQLKDHIDSLVNETPHGFSRQMSKMLISFHEPDNNRNQVFYCRLGIGDKDIVDKFIQKYCESSFPSKYFDYKGEEIKIYPMPDDTFLACYITSDFLVVSYQKRLIEQVIQCKLSQKSILNEPGFSPKQITARSQHPAVIHLKLNDMNLGKDSIPANIGGWTEFSVKISPDVIYLAGISHMQDSTSNFMNLLKAQKPVKNFDADILPQSTFYMNRHSIPDLQRLFENTNIKQPVYEQPLYINERNHELMRFFGEYSINPATTSMFYSSDTLYKNPCMVMNVPVQNAVKAERVLSNILYSIATDYYNPQPRGSIYHLPSGTYYIHALPENTLLHQLTGGVNSAMLSHICFYKNNMLIAPDLKSITSYLTDIEKGITLEKNATFEEAQANLSNSYNFLLMADLSQMNKHSGQQFSFVPNFFFRNSDLFGNFILSSQFTCVDNVVYPNIVLLYKSEERSYPAETLAKGNPASVTVPE